MKKIGIIPNREKDEGLKYTRVLSESVRCNGGEAILSSEVATELGYDKKWLDEDEVLADSEVVVCLGGDGTFLKAARKAYKYDIPLLGINLGSLGFLTEVEKNDIENAVIRLISDEYEIENRMMLEVSVHNRDNKVIVQDTALNDAVVSRVALSRILHLETYINGIYVDSFPGDGLIISTPTGSTAYSLSAGGPVVEPDADMIILTPICPHILYSKTFIASGNKEIKVMVDENYCNNAMVTIDGQIGYELRGGDIIKVKRSCHSVRVIRMSSRNFFNILRTKIYDRGVSFRKNEV